MSKILSCRDAGIDCDFVARGETEEDLFKACAEHGKKAHNMKSISDDLRVRLRQYIREG